MQTSLITNGSGSEICDNITDRHDNETDEEFSPIYGSPWTPNVAILSAAYIVFTTLGLIGNGMVITMIVRVLWSRRMVINVYVYVLCLSAVDFVFLATGPMTIAFMLHGNWTYGSALCKIAFFTDGLNKTMSIYLLVILSADRYLAVCKPHTSSRYRSVKAALAALLILFICVLVTNYPIYKFASVTARPTSDMYFSNETTNLNLNDSNIQFYCGLLFPKINESLEDNNPWNHMGSYYTVLLVVCYYLIPAGLICFFYVKLLTRIKQQCKHLQKRSSNRRHKIIMSTLSVVAFYFFCWTPYWLLQIIIQFFQQVTTYSEESSIVFIYLATTIYILPYVNSSIDPILYAFLNKRLRKAYAATSKRFTRNKQNKNNEFESTCDERSESRIARSATTIQTSMTTTTNVAGRQMNSPVPTPRNHNKNGQATTAFISPDQCRRRQSEHFLIPPIIGTHLFSSIFEQETETELESTTTTKETTTILPSTT